MQVDKQNSFQLTNFNSIPIPIGYKICTVRTENSNLKSIKFKLNLKYVRL